MVKNYDLAKEKMYPISTAVAGTLYTADEMNAAILKEYEFLGKRPDWAFWGPCGGPMFRVDLLASLLDRNPEIVAYNPDKADWKEYHAYQEMQARYAALGHFVYMGDETRATATAIEAGVHLFYGNSHFVMRDLKYGTVIEGRELTNAEVDTLNWMRRAIRLLAPIVGKPIYESIAEAGQKLPVDRSELIQDCVQSVSPVKKKQVRTWLSGAGYDHWMSSNDVFISDEPLQALKDALVATIYAQIRNGKEPLLTIHLPNTTAWKGQTVNGLDMSARRFKDFARPVSPYVAEFSVFTPAKVRVVTA